MEKLIQERDEAVCRAAECQEQLETILSTLNLTSKVAAMDCTAYHQSQTQIGPTAHRRTPENVGCVPLDRHDLANNNTDEEHSADCDTSNDISSRPLHHASNHSVRDDEEIHPKPSVVIQLQRLGDRLKKMSRDTTEEKTQPREKEGIGEGSETTQNRRTRRNFAHLRPLANLISSVHRLQSHLYHTQTEADIATEQAQTLQDDVVRYRQLKERNRKLEKAAKLLSRDNLVMTKELDGKEEELRRMQAENDKFLDYVDSRRACELDSAQTHLKAELLRHEKILRTGLKSQSADDGCCEVEIRNVDLDESDGGENVEIRCVPSRLHSVDEEKSLDADEEKSFEIRPAPLREDSVTCFLPASSYQLSEPRESKRVTPKAFLKVCKFMAEKRKKK